MVRLLALVLLAGCGDATQVLFHLEASTALLARTTSVAVVVTRADGTRFSQVDDLTGVDFPLTVPVVPVGGDASRRFRFEAALLDESGRVLSRVGVERGFVEGELVNVTLAFPDELSCEPRTGVEIDVPDLTVTEPVIVDVPGSELTITPNGTEHWIVMATGEWRSYPGTADSPSSIALLVDDVEHAYGEPVGNYGSAWHGVTAFEATGPSHTVRLRAHGSTMTDANLSDMKIIAFPLPPFADVQVAEAPGEVIVPTAFTQVVSLTFQPAMPGLYVFLISAAAGERPGGASIDFEVIDALGESWPAFDQFGFGREALLPYFIARTKVLPPEETTHTLRATSGSLVGATVRNARIIAFRADAFCDFAERFSNERVYAPSTDLVESQAPLAIGPTTEGTTWVTIQDQIVSTGFDATDARIVYLRDGTAVRDTIQQAISGNEIHPVGFADLVETNDAIEISSSIAHGNVEAAEFYRTTVFESHAIILRL
jgi:hypothetical protein